MGNNSGICCVTNNMCGFACVCMCEKKKGDYGNKPYLPLTFTYGLS